MPRGRHIAMLAAAFAVAAAAPAAHAAASPVPPVVRISSPAAGQIAVTGADALTAGVTELRFATKRSDATLALFELAPGVTPDQLAEALKTARGPRDVRDLAALRYAPEIARGQDATAFVDLRAGTYVAADVSGANAPPVTHPFTVAARAAGSPLARSPRATAKLGLRDFRFVAPARIAARGVLRYANTGRTFHYADAIRLRRGASVARALQALRAGRAQVPGSTGFSPLLGLVGPRQTGEVPYRLAPGTYVLVCFFADADSGGRPHTRLGMERAVTVR